MKEFKRVLVANRGEIALRVIRALKSLEIQSVAVFSDVDVSSLHVAFADRAFRLPGVYPKETYLNGKAIVEIAQNSSCDAIHPGYGFLSENSEFAKLCAENSIKFIGPTAKTLETSGNKLECKKLAESKNVPVIPYTREPLDDVEEAEKFSEEIGFPVLLKSAYGGGGRGIKEAKSRGEVREAFESSQREAKSAFGRFSIYIEKKLVKPRHIEIQILASDDSTKTIHLGERECSIQRRYQKLVEFSPSPVVDEETRERVAGYAIAVARAVKYSNAGTVEFLHDTSSGNFYFLEVNSRLQVEHPVTELVTGIDLVASQIRLASGEGLALNQKDVSFSGSAIECRINAEDALENFAPVSGRIDYLHLPSGPGVRVDTALYEGQEVPPYYDSLVAKLISWGRDFDEARRRELVALNEFRIAGIETTIPFHRQVMKSDAFAHGRLSTSFIEDEEIVPKLRAESAGGEAIPTGRGDAPFIVAALLLARRQEMRKRKVAGSPQATTTRPAPWIRERGKGGRFVDGL